MVKQAKKTDSSKKVTSSSSKVDKKVEAKTTKATLKSDSKDVKSSKKEEKSVAKPTKVEHGHLVSVEYTGTLKTGEEFDSSKGHGPIQFIAGSGQVIKGFDNAVIGMKVGESKKFNIPKNEAYGDVNPEMVQKIPLSKVPEHIKSQLKLNGFLVMQAPTGHQVPAKVVKLDKENVHLDMNHPLAGKDLTFDIKISDISHAPAGSDDCCGGGCCSDDGCSDDGCGDSCGCGHGHDHK